MLIVLQDINTAPKELKTERDCSHRQLFRSSWGSSVWRSIFLKLSVDKLPVANDRRVKFIFSNDSYEICCVYVPMAPHY